jgi:hypothetical protein
MARLSALESEWSGKTPPKEKRPTYFPALAPPPSAPPELENLSALAGEPAP